MRVLKHGQLEHTIQIESHESDGSVAVAKLGSASTVLVSAAAAQGSLSVLVDGLPSIGPQLRSEFGLSLGGVGAVLAANLLGCGLGLLAAGMAADTFGPRRAAVFGGALGVGFLMAAAIVQHGAVLLFGLLFVSGLGMAVIPIVGLTMVFRAFGAANRGRAFGFRQMAVPVGGLVGAVLLPLLDSVGGARAALMFCGVIIAAAFFGLTRILSSERESTRQNIAIRAIWKTPGLMRLICVGVLYIVVLQALMVYLIPALRSHAASALLAGTAFVAVNVVGCISRLFWGRIADGDDGTRRAHALSWIGYASAAAAVLFAVALHVATAFAVAAALMLAFVAFGWNAILYLIAAERADPKAMNQTVAGAATVVFVLAATCTPILGFVASRLGWDPLWLGTAGLAALGAIASRGLGMPGCGGATERRVAT